MKEGLHLFCIGAHMRGLALNWQLANLGATFVREASTVDCYAMFAVSGARPGILRVEDGSGGGVEVHGEVWNVPSNAWGAFMSSAVKSPLSIGWVRLRGGGGGGGGDGDEEQMLGFLCEAIATKDAKNIGQICGGKWRKWLEMNAAPN